ncbi:hypothetical protein BpHYR1_000149 [Brachionus plicatilis]|uniref:Uncharacterized protein n=1 Tax=Brachionus plicatilis TaxID=10195 RepID=A0A3M7SCU1_BRAPC|nr:hypothetical protein BpHYR1_000149 [Brachionus plicatilis]
MGLRYNKFRYNEQDNFCPTSSQIENYIIRADYKFNLDQKNICPNKNNVYSLNSIVAKHLSFALEKYFVSKFTYFC